MSRCSRRFVQILMASTSLLASAASAQSAASAGRAGQPHTSATGQKSAHRPPHGLTDIIVTAQRRGELMRKVPVSIVALSGAQLTESGIKSTLELPAIAPSLSIDTLGGGAVIFLRGVGTTNAVVGNEGSVAIYIDGVYEPSFTGANFDLDNVERVEVLKGPQGTLFGQSATGGAIQFIYPDPSHKFSGNAEVGYGNYNTMQASGYITGGLSEHLAADLSVNVQNQVDGFGRNLTTGAKNMYGYQISTRSKWLYTPTDATRITLWGAYSNVNDSAGSSYQFLPGAVGVAGQRTNGNPFDTYSTHNNVARSGSITASAKIEQELAFAKLVSISAFTQTESYYFFDIDQQTPPFLNANLPQENRSLSEELQLQSLEASPIKWIAGLYAYEDTSKYPLSLNGILLGPLVEQNYTHQALHSYASFGQVTIPLPDKFNLTLGARYTIDELNYAASQNFSGIVSVPYFKLPQVSTQKPTFRISVDKQIDTTLLYASFNSGYKTGTYNLINVSRDPPVLPEQLDAYEVGTKTRLFDNLLSLDLSGFVYKYSQIQVLVNEGSLAVIRNAAAATIEGGEAEFRVAPIWGLRLNGGVSYLYARFDSYPNAVFYTPAPTGGNIAHSASAAGNQLPEVPALTLNLSAIYDIDSPVGEFSLAGNFYRKGSFYWQADNRIHENGYNLTNFSLRWTSLSGAYNVTAYVDNLFDTAYYVDVQESSFGDFGNPGAPRTFGARLGVKF